jgi:hypothetical protein
MADENPRDCAERDPHTPAEKDVEAEFVVLSFVLDEHPVLLTIPEVSRALNFVSDDFGARDAVERAIRELDGAGLLHCTGGFAAPTRAAIYAARLWNAHGV